MMPAPKHLRGIVVPDDARIDESNLIGRLRCTCGAHALSFWASGASPDVKQMPRPVRVNGHSVLLIEARCPDCSSKHLILDTDYHGWNGFVGHDEMDASTPRPQLTQWTCPDCGADAHSGRITLCTDGRDDFAEETAGEFDPELWPEGFGAIRIDIECKRCGKKNQRWVEMETM